MKISVLAAPALLAVVFGPAVARANLALSLNSNASISALSAQLLKKPRSQAGNKVNVWDCDPPLAAVGGLHYFAYNLDASDNPLPQGSLVMTMRAARFGPGYAGNLEVLARSGPGQPTQWVQRSVQTQQFDLAGLQELGLARVTFSQFGAPGFITEDFDVEVDYDAQDINHQFANDRGFEHARFATEYLDHTPDAEAGIARGMMTAVVPAAYAGLAPPGQPFTTGFLDFGGGNVATGANVFTATVATDPFAQHWISLTDGGWEDTVRWQDGVFANGGGVTANFNAIDPTSVINVTSPENRALGGLTFADTDPATPGGYRLQGNTITLVATLPTIGLGNLNAASRARIDNVLAGNKGLTINGLNNKGGVAAGGLWLTAANTYVGNTTLHNATVYLGAPANAASAASFGAAGSTVVLDGANHVVNATTGANGQITLDHHFHTVADSLTVFDMGNRCDFGVPSGNPSSPTKMRSVTGSGTLALKLGTTVSGDRVYANFTGFTGRLIFLGSGTAQLFANTGVNSGFIGSGFGSADVVVDQSAVLAFQTDGGGTTTINMGSLAGSTALAGIAASSSGPVNLSIGARNSDTTFNGFIAGNNRVTKVGTGTLTLAGDNTYSGVTTVMAGTLSMTPAGRGLLLGGTGTTGGGDIRGGKLRFTYTTPANSPATTVKSLLTAGYAQATPFSSGALRSLTANTSFGLGWRDDTANSGVDVAYTYYGDADLDFAVGFGDLVLLAQNYNQSGRVWAQGDFNYDGNVDFNDLIPVAHHYGQSLTVEELNALGGEGFATDWALAMSLVPEPGSLSVLALGAMTFARRRR
jgi:autotransporter-associated beta strand protein